MAGILALAALGAGLRDAAAAAETAYLGLAAGIVLIAAAAVARGVTVPVLGTTAVVAIAWLLPAGPARGALVEAAAAATLALAAVERAWWSEGRAAHRAAGASGGLDALLRPVPAVGLALGLQALLRADELLAPLPALWALVVYLALPVTGAATVLVLARLDGSPGAALAAATVLVVGRGFRPATVVALVCLAAAWVLLDPGRIGAWRPRTGPWSGAVLRLGAGALLAAPFLWSPSAALVSVLAGGALALRHRPVLPFVVAAAALGIGIATLFVGGARTPAAALLVAVTVPAAVPTVVLPSRERLGVAVAAVALAVTAALTVGVEGSLAAPAALAAFAVAGGGGRAARTAPALQATWSLLLLAAAALAGSYPWLRGEALSPALELFGLPPDWTGALAVVTITLLLAGLARSLDHWMDAPAGRTAALLAVVLAACALLVAAPRPRAVLIDRNAPRTLDGPGSAWSARLDPRGEGAAVGTVVIDSALANARGLDPGAPVATVTLRAVDRPELLWTLRVGRETGEWAADRGAGPAAASAGTLDPTRPAPWVSWVPAPEETGPSFYGHAYRTTLPVRTGTSAARADPSSQGGGAGAPLRADRLELRLRPDLPPEVILTVYRLELRR